MKVVLSNWKTSTAGAASVLTALGTIFHMVSTGTFDATQLQTAVAALVAGVGLIFSQDIINPPLQIGTTGKVTQEPPK